MADNVSITPGSGATVAADDIGGVLHQRIKLGLGADGAATDALGGAGAVAAGVQRMTLASDDPAVALLGTIDADTSSLAGAVAGTEVQVDVVAALPAGSNSIGAVTNTHLTNALIGEYETVAASQTAQVLGGAGAAGDYLARVIIVPATTSPGTVAILDNATSITIFAGGAASLTELKPIVVDLGMTSVSGAWKVTTGADVSVIAVGNFSA